MTATHWLAFGVGVVVGQLALLAAIAFGIDAKHRDRMREQARGGRAS